MFPDPDIPLYGECSHSNDTCADSDAVCIDEDDDPHGGEHHYMCQCKYDFIEIKGTCVKCKIYCNIMFSRSAGK